jgi:hypothetical protein
MRMEKFELSRKIKIDGFEFVENITTHGKVIDEKENRELYMFISLLLGKTKYHNYSLEKILKTVEKSYILMLKSEHEEGETYLTLNDLTDELRKAK